MKNKKLQKKLLKLTQEFRDETADNAERFIMGLEQDCTAYLRLMKFVQKQLKKESKK